MNPNIVTLRFDNRDAMGEDEGKVQSIKLRVERSAVKHIMAWYGAYYAGDDYDVFINGRKQAKDKNGEFEHETVDTEAVAARTVWLASTSHPDSDQKPETEDTAEG